MRETQSWHPMPQPAGEVPFIRWAPEGLAMLCAQCGKEHPVSEMELTFRRPDAVAALDERERESRVQESRNFCVMDGERFFVRVLLPLPVHGRAIPYNIGLWAEVDKRSFERVYELWEETDRGNEPPMHARLANEVPFSDNSLGMQAELHLIGGDSRPCVYLRPSEHPLFGEQQSGVFEHRIHEYTSLFASPGA
jgi:hypothetical protein